MKHKKNFYVVAYDIADNARRAKVAKILEGTGVRVNYSVFECFLTPSQYKSLTGKLSGKCHDKHDCIIIYPLCIDCYSKIEYLAGTAPSSKQIITLI